MHELIAARLWLTVYQLPPYAPELNPIEGVWSHLKRSLANLTKHSLDQLTAMVKTRLKRMQYRRLRCQSRAVACAPHVNHSIPHWRRRDRRLRAHL
ncbi:transposase [Stenotrophomonas sp. NPDC087984]